MNQTIKTKIGHEWLSLESYQVPANWKIKKQKQDNMQLHHFIRPPHKRIFGKPRLDLRIFRYYQDVTKSIDDLKKTTYHNINRQGYTISVTKDNMATRHDVDAHEVFFEGKHRKSFVCHFIKNANEFVIIMSYLSYDDAYLDVTNNLISSFTYKNLK